MAVAGFVSRDRKNVDLGMVCTEETYRSILWYRRIVVEADNGVHIQGNQAEAENKKRFALTLVTTSEGVGIFIRLVFVYKIIKWYSWIAR